jgi:glycosyltransferase involved in cell wall biosynthesis
MNTMYKMAGPCGPGEDSVPQMRQFVDRLHSGDVTAGAAGLPKISVVMPSFNHRQFIERSLLSVLNQRYANVELIVVDGGSTDGTVDIIRKYEQHLAYWISEPDKGQSDALNKGFARATGDIYGWLNSDDLYTPVALHRAVAAFLANPGTKIVHGDWMTIDSDDRTIEREYSFDFNLNHFKYEGFVLNAQATFWRPEVHRRFGGFDQSLHNTMDYQMLLAFGINEGNAAFLRIPDILGCFRRHEDQKTGGAGPRVANEHRLMAQRYGYADKYLALGRVKYGYYRLRRGYWYFKRGGAGYFLQKLKTKMLGVDSALDADIRTP